MKDSRKKCIRILNDLSVNGHLSDDDYFALMDFVVGREDEAENNDTFSIKYTPCTYTEKDYYPLNCYHDTATITNETL